MSKNIMMICATAFAIGCAPTVPKELADARAAYTRAAQGPAATYVPADLHKAEESLAKAERAFHDDPEARYTRDVAYVAERKAELAEALAAQEMQRRTKEASDKEFQKTLIDQQAMTKGQLAQTREELAEAEARRKAQAGQLTQEQQARMDAERKVQDAEARLKVMQESLAKLAAVKEEQRGLVITLSGSVLFASDQSVLLPEAQSRLEQVAAALMSTKERNIIIEGHTDARGSESHNIDLSQRRAEAVRGFLVNRGYESDRIKAMGIGKARPIADNASAEGRANNRRVEIIVEPDHR